MSNMSNSSGSNNSGIDKRIALMEAISDIRKLTYDPALRQLLTDLEIERAELEETARREDEANNLYLNILARMSHARNRRTYFELCGLAEVEQLGWLNDPRRRNVDIACSERAAIGYGLNCNRGDNGPREDPTETWMFDNPRYAVASTCEPGCDCQMCRPVSPGTKRTGFTESTERWQQRVAQRARTV